MNEIVKWHHRNQVGNQDGNDGLEKLGAHAEAKDRSNAGKS